MRKSLDSFQEFLDSEPATAAATEESLVEFLPLSAERSLPLLARPLVDDVDIVGWARHHRGAIEAELHRHGAVLFRGFETDIQIFEQFAGAVSTGLYGEYGDLPKELAGEQIYQSTPYPADKTILFHNESSHMDRWPMKQFFHCVTAAREGGETPIVDCRQLYAHIPAEIREALESRRLLYVRNFKEGLDVSWQDFFHTDDRSQVEERCRQNAIRCAWQEDEGLRLLQPGLAVAVHPKTGEKVFFNQVLLHHVACLEDKVASALRMLYADEDLPRTVCYGDGAPIEDQVIEAVLGAYWDLAVAAPWQEGDILMVDNMLVAHARNPFVGPRKIVVAMGEMVARTDIERLA